jgi:hypothetical protein
MNLKWWTWRSSNGNGAAKTEPECPKRLEAREIRKNLRERVQEPIISEDDKNRLVEEMEEGSQAVDRTSKSVSRSLTALRQSSKVKEGSA